jgi:hypothetical protein
VKTVDGLMDLQVPAGTQPGDVLVMSKLGVPKLNKVSVRGDHFFTIKVAIPTRLSETERTLVEDLAQLHMTKGRGGSVKMKANSRPQRAHDGRTTVQEKDSEASPLEENKADDDSVLGAVKNFVGRRGSSGPKFASVLQERSPFLGDAHSIGSQTSRASFLIVTLLLAAAFFLYPSVLRVLSWLLPILSSLYRK